MDRTDLNIRCNPNQDTCRIKYVVERSDSCTKAYGGVDDPIGLVNKYHGSVIAQVVEGRLEIETSVTSDAYCRTSPPLKHPPHFLWYAYNEGTDTLQDFGAEWTRK